MTTTMRYNEFKKELINNVYLQYAKGNPGAARTAIAKIYREGCHNPRGTLFRIISGGIEVKDVFINEAKKIEKAGKYREAQAFLFKYFDINKEITTPNHPMVAAARDEFIGKLNEMNVSSKNRKFSKFILLKQEYPIIGKLKFLAKFL